MADSTPFVDFGRKDQYSVPKLAMGDTESILPLLKERNQKWYAVSNYGECSGWVNQYFKCIKEGITPILGMQLYVNNYRFSIENEVESVHRYANALNESLVGLASNLKHDELDWATLDFPIDVFARTMEGYYNVIKLHNDAQINGMYKRPRTQDEFVASHAKGVVALLPTPFSQFSMCVFNNESDNALKTYEYYKKVFDDVYVEIPIVESEDYREINAKMIAFCNKHCIKMIPVVNSHYNEASDAEMFPIFQKVGSLKGGVSFEVEYTPNMYYKTREEVWDTFKKYHESNVFTEDEMRRLFSNLDALCNTFTALELDTTPKTPHFENSDVELREHAWEGFEKYGFDKKENADEYKRRLEYELDNIIRAGFADYFILVERMFDWLKNKQHRITSTGRGSASGSLTLRCLGVTKIDPLEHNLLFERFLDASRLDEIINKGGKVSGADYPDIDNDVLSNIKDDVKKYFANVYGKENTCSIGTIGYLHIKSSLKELGRVYAIDDKEINVLTTVGLKDLEAEDDELPLDELRQKFNALNDFLVKYPQVEKAFSKLQGSINCWGVHAGGVLISDSPIINQLPVRVNNGKLVTTWCEGLNGRELGEMGFLKLDILAIETLDIIEEALNLINKRYGTSLAFDDIPLEYPNALKRIADGNNQGVFQFETPLALQVCQQMNGIHNFEDIASLSTLMRPAALQNGFGKKYGDRREGSEKYFIPECMKPYIGNEFGLPIFQEGAYFFGIYMAGFDKVAAYKFMKLLYKGKMKGDKIPEWHNKFIKGCIPKIKHEEYEIEFENGIKKCFTEFDKLTCIDGQEHTVKEIVEKNLDIDESQIV